MTRSSCNVGSGGSVSGSSMNSTLRAAPPQPGVLATALCTDLCTGPLGSGQAAWDAARHQIQIREHSPRRARRAETNRDVRNLRRGAHNPEVAGSNPAPATNPLVRGLPIGRPLPFHDLVVSDVVNVPS